MRLILYSKPGCHLCEGLQEKLEQIQAPSFALEIRDITSRDDWFQAYQYEIPVLWMDRELASEPDHESDRESDNLDQASLTSPVLLPRFSPRASVQQIAQTLQKYLDQGYADR